MTALDTPTTGVARPTSAVRHFVRRNVWTLGLVGILAVLLVVTKIIQPNYGPAAIQGLAISVLPLAFAAVAQTCVVLSKGIDLSVGSMMAFTSVVAAALME
ncbi:MAG TPA: hypothetical protein VE569_12225, partial [Acidimicrobiia bacterium]|nr:hypothetical protein [Acidimicrobiia bacterium]